MSEEFVTFDSEVCEGDKYIFLGVGKFLTELHKVGDFSEGQRV